MQRAWDLSCETGWHFQVRTTFLPFLFAQPFFLYCVVYWPCFVICDYCSFSAWFWKVRGLSGSTCGYIRLISPPMCNLLNLACRKTAILTSTWSHKQLSHLTLYSGLGRPTRGSTLLTRSSRKMAWLKWAVIGHVRTTTVTGGGWSVLKRDFYPYWQPTHHAPWVTQP
jgi:hypothetical protein